LEQMRPLVEQWLATLPATHRAERWRDVGIRPPGGVVEKTVRKGVEPKASTVVVFSGETPYTPETRYALRSLSEYLEMRLLDNLREALGGTYSVGVDGSASKSPNASYSVTIQYGSSPVRADSLFRTVLAVIDSTKAGHITDADVQKVREQQLRSFEVNQKENSYWLANLAGRIENGEDPRGLLTYDQLIHALTADQIQRAARQFLDLTHYARFVLLPVAVQP